MSNPARSVLPVPAAGPSPSTNGGAVTVRDVSLTVLAVTAVIWLLNWAQAVFVPIVLSLLVSYALEPAVRWLVRIRLPRMAASAVVVALATGGAGYGAYSISDDAAAMVAALPEAASRLRRIVQRDQEGGTIQQVTEAANELQRTADEAAGPSPAPRGVQRVQIEEPAIDVREYLTWGSASALAFAGQAALVIFFVFFLLASGDMFKRKIVRLAGPSLEKKKITVQIFDDINFQIERFLLVHLVASIVVGFATWIAFRAVGLEQAAVWAVAAGLFNNIPYFGPLIVSAGAATVAFMQFGTLSMALYTSGVALAITSLEGWLLMPMLTRRTSSVNEVAIFVALIFWSFIWGIWGTLLAVPMLVSAKACCDRIEGLKPIGELLGE
jgi:predicted PurR-regulated permease PerM